MFEIHGVSVPCTELLIYANVNSVLHSMAPLTTVSGFIFLLNEI